MTLDELEQGKKGIIEDLEISGMTLQRLISLGFTPGAEVSVVRKAPLLDPFDISICGSLVAVRKDEAKKIIVKEV
ncbi:ferrous iron transport protein A [Treponema sp. OMZ 792]|uniref:FeoA family protein n=1 Tax=unclassified Treponema TaxID=2638727 RepID=UPI0020A60D02|nr:MULTISPECIES: ferrous iron transport protein A [unclassified Treponema]UTC61803.1 ferrous iron transport protein A [Treponema sp. OMZ 787]UTC65181.1 ferrous iron transport protein A [Treponema sp. OMZ 788]UTC67713.1 ferrous iron transport protein A [Treponema sp. OMZ 789]UTC70441.1 ferrous iron transport protein A [Treponema sp. OMZ 790]UTC73154.1 ferrous iron transport protein A [Treponema sp. OMZ 791]